MGRPSARDRARELLARRFEARSPLLYNTASLIRTGWENFWLTPCLDVVEQLVLLSGYGDDEDEAG